MDSDTSSESLINQVFELKDNTTLEENEKMDLTLGNKEEMITDSDLIQTLACNSNTDNMELTKTCDEHVDVGEVTIMTTEGQSESHRQPHSDESKAKVTEAERPTIDHQQSHSDENVTKVGEVDYDRLEVGAIGGNKGGDNNEEHDEDISKTKHCEPCLFDEIEADAVAFCVICIEYLCSGCARDHRRSKVTRSHKVLHNNELPKDASIFKIMMGMMCCTDHPEMEVSYKCEEHDLFICIRCLAVNHRKCSEVTEVSNEPVFPNNDHVEPTLHDQMKTLHDKTISVRISKQENISSMLLEQANITKERMEYIDCIQEHLLNLSKKSDIETEALLTKELVELVKSVKECREIETSEVMYIELLNAAMQHGSVVQLNVICELIKKKADHLKNELKVQDIKETVHLKFEKNTHFIDVTLMGNVLVVRGEKKEGIQTDNPEKQINMERSCDAVDDSILPDLNNQTMNAENKVRKAVEQQLDQQNNLPLMQCQLSRTGAMYHISHYGDGDVCSISEIVVLSDGRLAVVDDKNANIKVLNPDFSIAFVYELENTPLDLCQISDKILVIIYSETKRVNRYSLCDDTIIEIGGFDTTLYPISIDKCNENVVILFTDVTDDEHCRSDNDIIEVQIRNVTTGAILQTITEFNNKSSRELILVNPARIRVRSAEMKAYLISEENKLTWFEVDTNNNECFKATWFYKSYKDNHIAGICDIAMDSEGNIYVCGQHSRNIHQISGENGMKNRVLLSIPGNPRSVSVDDKRRHLIVGYDRDDCIHVIPLV